MKRRKVYVLLEVDVDDKVHKDVVRQHIRNEAHAAKGQYTGEIPDWRADIYVELRNLGNYTRRITNRARRTKGVS